MRGLLGPMNGAHRLELREHVRVNAQQGLDDDVFDFGFKELHVDHHPCL